MVSLMGMPFLLALVQLASQSRAASIYFDAGPRAVRHSAPPSRYGENHRMSKPKQPRAPAPLAWDEGVVLATSTVNLAGLHPRLANWLSNAGKLHLLLFGRSLIVTSGNDGKHARPGPHFSNQAVDLRTRDKTPAEGDLFLLVCVNLGRAHGIGVFDERENPRGPHFHAQVWV